MKRHFLHSSRDPDYQSWTTSPGSETSQYPEWRFLLVPTLPPWSTITFQSLSNLEHQKFPLCEQTSLSTLTLATLSQPFSSTASLTSQTSIPTSTPPSLQNTSHTNTPQKIITSTIPGKVLVPSFSTTTTSTVVEIITPSSASQTPSSSNPPLTSPLNAPNRHSTFLSRLSTDAKVAIFLALTLLILCLTILAILACTRHKRRYPAQTHRQNSILSYAHETQPLTSTTPEPYGIQVFEAAEPRTDVDEDGVRWPEKVVLRGDAKEIREWTGECGKRRALESYGLLWMGGG